MQKMAKDKFSFLYECLKVAAKFQDKEAEYIRKQTKDYDLQTYRIRIGGKVVFSARFEKYFDDGKQYVFILMPRKLEEFYIQPLPSFDYLANEVHEKWLNSNR